MSNTGLQVDFSERGLVRTGQGHRSSKKKRKLGAKSPAAKPKKSQKGDSKGDSKAVTPVQLTASDGDSDTDMVPMGAVSTTSLKGAEISADSSVRKISVSSVFGYIPLLRAVRFVEVLPPPPPFRSAFVGIVRCSIPPSRPEFSSAFRSD